MENCLCDECGSRIVIENGENVCQKCGLVHDPILESSSFQLGSRMKSENRKSQPCMGHRYYLYSNGKRICVSGGSHGLGKPEGSFMATVEHLGYLVLS